MKIHVVVFGVMTPCSDVVGHQHFGGSCFLFLLNEDGGSMVSYHITARRHNPEDHDKKWEW